jgi:hypothetical protein
MIRLVCRRPEQSSDTLRHVVAILSPSAKPLFRAPLARPQCEGINTERFLFAGGVRLGTLALPLACTNNGFVCDAASV